MGDYSDAEPSLTARNHWRHHKAVIRRPRLNCFMRVTAMSMLFDSTACGSFLFDSRDVERGNCDATSIIEPDHDTRTSWIDSCMLRSWHPILFSGAGDNRERLKRSHAQELSDIAYHCTRILAESSQFVSSEPNRRMLVLTWRKKVRDREDALAST